LAASDVLVIPFDQEAAKIHHVLVEGEVMFPGRYPIRNGIDSAADALAQAGGFTAEANVAAARISRARPPAELEGAAGGAAPPMPATPAAMPVTSEAGRLDEPAAAETSGPPPTFSDLPRATRERELASRSPAGDEVRASWTSVPLADSVRLRDGDRIFVPKLEGRVRVDGRVRAPGLVPFEPGLELDDYVKLAGGLDKKADKGRVYLQRAGRPGFESASGAGPIRDGDAIWVPESEPRGFLNSTRDFVIFLAQVATIAIVVDQLVN
ncbi:MAG TPA: SLBB domain-containing protein, partial [Candidatus Udaeobacter sp.]|nr:SLBB domain-containing protein [Candidatus Udaeobacter sp.]